MMNLTTLSETELSLLESSIQSERLTRKEAKTKEVLTLIETLRTTYKAAGFTRLMVINTLFPPKQDEQLTHDTETTE